MVNTIDVVLVVLIVGVVALETKRGFGRAIFDFAALLIAVRIAPLLVPAASKSLQLARDAQANEAILFAAIFVLTGGALLYLGKLAYDSTLISLDTFDPFFGGVAGFAVVLIVGHAVVKALAISAGVDGAPPDVLASSSLGMQFYRFGAYHQVMDFLVSLPD